MADIEPYAIPALVAVLAAAGSWFVARLQRSGRVDTSEAGDLWRAQTEFRDAVAEQLAQVTVRLEKTEQRLETSEEENYKNKLLLLELREKERECQEQNRIKDAQIERLEEEQLRLRQENDRLRDGLNIVTRKVENGEAKQGAM